MKLKKTLLSLSMLTITSMPIVAIVSCVKEENKKFDIGYAIPDITSLNYIKYESIVGFAHSVVESFGKTAPIKGSSLATYLLNTPKLHYKTDKRYSVRNASLNFNYTSGILKTELRHNPQADYPGMESFHSTYHTFLIRLNGKSKWSNGDLVTPSNFIDAFVYVLDLNTGSQLLNRFLKLQIKHSQEFVSAQISYAKKYKQLYKNPFGYIKNSLYDPEDRDKRSIYWVQRKDDFPLQIYTKPKTKIDKMPPQAKAQYLQNQKNEIKMVEKIRFFAKNFGIYADLGSSHPYDHMANIKVNELKSKNRNTNAFCFVDDVSHEESGESIYPNIFQIQTSVSKSAFQLFINTLIKSYWLPINKRFVESIGGIEKFGLNLSKFLTQGPFNIASIILGRGGSAVLTKNEAYWDSKNTIPNKIKIFFQTDPIVISSLFEDGYISNAKLNGIVAQKLYSQKEYRELLYKSSGYGTTGLVFNLDKNAPGHNAIVADENLRKAIFYAIDRDEIIKLSGFDSTIPAYSFIDSDSRTGASWWISPNTKAVTMIQKIGNSVYYDKFTPNIPQLMFPYKIPSLISKGIVIGNFNRKDLYKNDKLAQKYLNEFLKKHPGNHVIEYIHDSTKPFLQIGIAVQSAIKRVFGNKLKISIKGYPKTIYDTFYSSGNFQLTYRNLDYLMSSNASGGTSAFYLPDAINIEDQKSRGFIGNPTGGWTFRKIVKHPSKTSTAKEKAIMKRLEIRTIIWDKIHALTSLPANLQNLPSEEKGVFMRMQLDAFFTSSDFIYGGTTYAKDQKFLSVEGIVELAGVANKLLLEASPIIPLFVVDNVFEISRIVNYNPGINNMSCYDYGYDYQNKPLNNLPGREALTN